jgi:hypothetical protein
VFERERERDRERERMFSRKEETERRKTNYIVVRIFRAFARKGES